MYVRVNKERTRLALTVSDSKVPLSQVKRRHILWPESSPSWRRSHLPIKALVAEATLQVIAKLITILGLGKKWSSVPE